MKMTIKLYTTATCPWCIKAKEWLKKKKYHFEEFNVAEKDEYMDEVLEKSGQLSLPVFDINGRIIVGFYEDKIEETVKNVKEKKS
ncbi:MAG: glutaredoxin domain-containing protein [Nanoarchaeota archaeon]